MLHYLKRKPQKILRFNTVGIIILSMFCCSGPQKNKSQLEAIFVPVLTIGKEQSDSSYYNFNRIDDIHVDRQMRIYICDYIERAVYVYDSTGVFLRIINSGVGQGPGECTGPMHVRTTAQGEVAILDQKQNKIAIYSNKGPYLKDIILRDINPAKMEITDSTLLAIGRFHIYPGGIIHEYDFKTGKLLKTFGRRGPDSLAVSRAGNWDVMACRDNEVLLSHAFPYQIDCYGADRELKYSFMRPIKFNKPPYPAKMNFMDVYGWNYVPKALCVLPNGNILHFIAHFENNAFKSQDIKKFVHFYCDFFDPKGEHLLTIPLPSHGIENDWIRIVTTDRRGNVYMDLSEPFPHVVKYKLIFQKQ